ncbi:dGTP triphosphohydrolase, partial [Methanocalculus sp.]|uniref:deoxyguanosinetriphosphate triphosphohydrolase family protein n=1 Tax=Methanocalculus sp. TaxID=2004547 RepID=UPI002612A7EE
MPGRKAAEVWVVVNLSRENQNQNLYTTPFGHRSEKTEGMEWLHPLAMKNDSKNIKHEYEYPDKGAQNPGYSDTRGPFQRDRDRILYSKSFRRLMHKTQVSFTGSMNENIRTRLSHTLEVSQIARTMARFLKVNEDLVEAIALGHDVGHTPFGHIGEAFLNDIVSGGEEGFLEKFSIDSKNFDSMGFKHNFQSVRVLMEFEKGYSSHKGLNISYPVLEGILKHSKLYYSGNDEKSPICYRGISDNAHFNIKQPFASTIEGQIVNLADEIAQVCHDIEDAIEANYDSKKFIIEALNEEIQKGLFEGIDDQPFFLEGEQKEVDRRYFKEFISWVIGKIILDSVEIISQNMNDYLNKHKPDPDNGEYYPIIEDIATESVLEDHKIFKFLKEDIQKQYIITNYRINRENGKNRFILR